MRARAPSGAARLLGTKRRRLPAWDRLLCSFRIRRKGEARGNEGCRGRVAPFEGVPDDGSARGRDRRQFPSPLAAPESFAGLFAFPFPSLTGAGAGADGDFDWLPEPEPPVESPSSCLPPRFAPPPCFWVPPPFAAPPPVDPPASFPRSFLPSPLVALSSRPRFLFFRPGAVSERPRFPFGRLAFAPAPSALRLVAPAGWELEAARSPGLCGLPVAELGGGHAAAAPRMGMAAGSPGTTDGRSVAVLSGHAPVRDNPRQVGQVAKLPRNSPTSPVSVHIYMRGRFTAARIRGMDVAASISPPTHDDSPPPDVAWRPLRCTRTALAVSSRSRYASRGRRPSTAPDASAGGGWPRPCSSPPCPTGFWPVKFQARPPWATTWRATDFGGVPRARGPRATCSLPFHAERDWRRRG